MSKVPDTQPIPEEAEAQALELAERLSRRMSGPVEVRIYEPGVEDVPGAISIDTPECTGLLFEFYDRDRMQVIAAPLQLAAGAVVGLAASEVPEENDDLPEFVSAE